MRPLGAFPVDRAFLVLRTRRGSADVRNLIHECDGVLADFGHPPYYTAPVTHTSLASWALRSASIEPDVTPASADGTSADAPRPTMAGRVDTRDGGAAHEVSCQELVAQAVSRTAPDSSDAIPSVLRTESFTSTLQDVFEVSMSWWMCLSVCVWGGRYGAEKNSAR